MDAARRQLQHGDNASTHDKEPFTPFGRMLGTGMTIVEALNAEHREGPGVIRAASRTRSVDGGNAWLDTTFSRLDVITKATIRQ